MEEACGVSTDEVLSTIVQDLLVGGAASVAGFRGSPTVRNEHPEMGATGASASLLLVLVDGKLSSGTTSELEGVV
jgi:hypothetical protein